MNQQLQNQDEFIDQEFDSLTFTSELLLSKEFESCTFSGCDFSQTQFNRCWFVDCKFTLCNLSSVDFSQSKLSNVLFNESKLMGIDFNKVAWPKFIKKAPIGFEKCLLNDASFWGLTLLEMKLEHCIAQNTDFREGNFTQASFIGTDFTRSTFSNTNLSEVDFTDALNFDIDVYNNTIQKAKFSRYEAFRLLGGLEIELVD